MVTMEIERAEVIVTSPGRNFVTLRLTTDDGRPGRRRRDAQRPRAGGGRLPPGPRLPLLIGRDPQRIEDTWQYLYRGAYWRRGPVTMAAIAAVDVALWDIKAKLAGMPLYQLLGGASRRGLLAYGHASGADIPSLFESIDEHSELGYRAIRIQTGVPGLGRSTASRRAAARDALRLRAGPRGQPSRRRVWDTRAYLRHVPAVFEAVRDEFGPELPLLHDVHHRLTPIQAAKLGKSLEPYDCSGWRTAPRPRTRRRCGWSASTPRRRWRSARCSTPSGTTRP